MDAQPGLHIQRSSKQPSEKPSGSRRHQQRTSSAKQRKGQSNEHRVRGGATPTALHPASPAHMDATSSRHRRHRQPPSPAPDRRLATRPSEVRSALLPPSSPTRDSVRRAQRSAAIDTETPRGGAFFMDEVLGSRPVVSQYSEDVIMEAIELSRDALRPAAGRSILEDERSLELRREGRISNPSPTTLGKTPQPTKQGYQVSAERSTVTWTREDPVFTESSPPVQIPSPSVGAPQHM
ncbi:hypothetical protein BV20DRAFT_20703 [Pilatotrama ljubarskyi]|nr:hypothetical protein BV20DRAFT_20703 [Pilatotrama ljubarskyi]